MEKAIQVKTQAMAEKALTKTNNGREDFKKAIKN